MSAAHRALRPTPTLLYYCATCGARTPTVGVRAMCIAGGCDAQGRLIVLTPRGWMRSDTVRALGLA